MERKQRRLSESLVITLWGVVGSYLGAGFCLGLALLPALRGAADDLPPPRDAPGMVAGGAAVVGMWVGGGVGIFFGYRYAKRRRE
jgi:hypothetical protein